MRAMDTEDVQPLLALPAELIYHILTFLPPTTLAAVSATCNLLRHHALVDQLWQGFVNDNLPEPLHTPTPLSSFRDLYIAHHPYWFLPKHKIWYSDSEPSGKLLVVRYDPRRGCIEAYAVVAERGLHTFEMWQHDPGVAIHSFNPRVQLDLNQPVLKLDIGSPRVKANTRTPRPHSARHRSRWFGAAEEESDSDSSPEDTLPPLSREILMDCSAPAGLYTSFLLARDIPTSAIGTRTALWPPRRIPALSRTRNASSASFAASGHRPTTISEVSQNTFRLRKWLEFSGRHQSTSIMTLSGVERLHAALGAGFSAQNLMASLGGGMSVRMGEEVATFGTLPPSCFTPTKEKPWRGIWCGDYSGHGCEFLVVLQPDAGEESPLPAGMDWMQDWLATGRQRRESASSRSSYVSAQEALQEMHQEAATTNAEAEDDEQDSSSSGDDPILETAAASPLGRLSPVQHGSPHPLTLPGPSTAAAAEAEATLQEETIYSGRIEAVKLTGDPNIPRGEYTFIAPDISDAGLVRIAEEEIFKGARVVRSAGHIANRGFVGGKSLVYTFATLWNRRIKC